jgi:hypothetical protein
MALTQYWYLIKGSEYQNILHKILPASLSSLSVQITNGTLELELLDEDGWSERELEMISLD